MEALAHHPGFEEYLAAFCNLTLGMDAEPETLRTALTAIGALDLLVAGLVLVRGWWPVLLWMALWGAVTAGARVVHGGPGAAPQALLRVAHGVLPAVAAWWAWRRRPAGRTDMA